MRRRQGLVPGPIDSLESRVVPSHFGKVGVVTLVPVHRALSRGGPSITAEVNQEFDSFRNDYDQARATYFTSIQNQTNPGQATTYAFVAYTTQRVSLLAQQTLGILSPLKHGRGASRAMKQLVATKIIGPRQQMPPGSLARSLLETIPQPGTTAPTSSLYTLSQDSAISAAQVAILNGLPGHRKA